MRCNVSDASSSLDVAERLLIGWASSTAGSWASSCGEMSATLCMRASISKVTAVKASKIVQFPSFHNSKYFRL